MAYALPFLLLWLVAGLAAGEMIIDNALNLMEDGSFGDNFAAVLLLFTFAAVLALPWLIWRAAAEGLNLFFRR